MFDVTSNARMWILATIVKHENIVTIKICYKTKIAFEICFYAIIYKFMTETRIA